MFGNVCDLVTEYYLSFIISNPSVTEVDKFLLLFSTNVDLDQHRMFSNLAPKTLSLTGC